MIPFVLLFPLQFIKFLFLTVYHATWNFCRRYFPSFFSKDVQGEVILITGSGSGLGRGVAIKFAKLGAVVVGVDVNKAGNEETAK